jgi:hypothetical protein
MAFENNILGDNGNIDLSIFADVAFSGDFNDLINIPSIFNPGLQEVTDISPITTNSITVGGLTSGNLFSDGYNFGISDSFDTNYNLLYQPYVGLILDDFSGNQSILSPYGLQLNSGTLSYSGPAVGWSLPSSSGTIALISDINGYFPIPTGTINEYVRGDGSLDLFSLENILNSNHTLTNGINLQGTGAGVGNTGLYVNIFGEYTGVNNSGNNCNLIGMYAGTNNTGDRVTAIGGGAGANNTHDDVYLFGVNATADENGQMVFSKNGSIYVKLSTSLLDVTRKYNFPNSSGTFALTSNIPTLISQLTDDIGFLTYSSNPSDIGALAIDGSNANSNIDLGDFGIRAGEVVTQTNGTTKKMTLRSSNVNSEYTAEWQDKNYTGIADITDIPDISGLVPFSGAATLLDLGANGLEALKIVTKTNGDTKKMTLSSYNVSSDRSAEWQDKDYTGIADITDIPSSTASLPDSTDKRYVTDAELTKISAIDQAVSTTEKATWNGKQNALGFTPYKYLNTTPYTIAGVILETIVATAFIPAGTFNSSDVIKIIFNISKNVSTSNGSMKVKINTANTLTGAVQIAYLQTQFTFSYQKLVRSFALNNGNLSGINFTTSAVTDEVNNGSAPSTTAYNTANDLYVFFTLQQGNTVTSEYLTFQLANITN